MTLEELYEMNPSAKDAVVIGETLNVTEQKPMVSVKSVETQVLTSVEPKQYETQYDDTKPASYQRVIQQGKDGQKKHHSDYTRQWFCDRGKRSFQRSHSGTCQRNHFERDAVI